MTDIESAEEFVAALTAAGENKFFQYEFMLSTIARVWLTEAITARDAAIRAAALEEAAAIVERAEQDRPFHTDTELAADIRALATKGPSK